MYNGMWCGNMCPKFIEEQDEWIKEYSEIVNNNEEFQDAVQEWGSDFNGNYLYAYQNIPGGGPDEAVDFIEMGDGIESVEHTGLTLDEAKEEYDWGFVVKADYDTWKRLIEGDLGPVEGLMRNDFLVDGDMETMLQYQEVTQILGNSFTEPETKLPA